MPSHIHAKSAEQDFGVLQALATGKFDATCPDSLVGKDVRRES